MVAMGNQPARVRAMSAKHWILLPGLDGSGQLFEGILQHVPRDQATIVAYPADTTWGIDDYVAHAEAAVPDDMPCILIAESFSGPIALRLVQRNTRIRGAVLVASFVTCPHPLLRLVPLRFAGLWRKALRSNAMLRTFCLGWHASDALVASLKAIVEALPISILQTRLRLLRNLDESGSLARARVPLLLLEASNDKLVCAPVDGVGRLVQHAVVDGPHFLLQSRPEECWRTISAWECRVP